MKPMTKILIIPFAASVAAGCALWVQHDDAARHSRDKLAALSAGHDEAPRPEFPGEAAAFQASLHETGGLATPAELNHRAMRDAERDAAERAAEGVSGLPNMNIESWGPGNFGGRLRGIVIHPSTPDTMLIGSVSGGIWKTEDGGESWHAVDDFLTSLAVGSMAVDPDNPDRVFAGTGEGFFNVDAAQGRGIFVSEDFGDSWTQLASTDTTDFQYVNRLGLIPGTDVLLAATRSGIWRSTDLGATSSWTEVSGFSASSRGFVDLKVDPFLTSRMYAYHYGGGAATRLMFRSVDSGVSFQQLGAAEGVPTTDIGRMEIGIGSDGVVYLAVANNGNSTRGLWRSPAGGAAFVRAASNTAFIERQGWYDLICGVDPNDSDTVYIGAVDVYRTTNQGASITKQSFWNASAGQGDQFVHADVHVVAFHPSQADTLFIGADGGIFKSIDGGDTFIDLNNDIRVTQYYGIAAHPDGEQVIGGTQDNGSHYYFGERPIWLMWFSGDGGFSAWDQQQTQFIYGALPGAGLFGSNDEGVSASLINLPNTTGALFISPFTLDPNDGNRMIAGTDNIFYSSNVRSIGAATWSDASGLLGAVSATTISPLDGAVAYAGTTAGRIYETTGLGSGGPFVRIDSGQPVSDVTWVEVDQNDVSGNTLYATFADYGADRVWKTTNGGASWTSIHGNLPDIPMFSITVDPTDPDRLFLGSELGLWTSDDNGSVAEGGYVWERFDYGPAWTRVQQLIWVGDDTLWLGTHGRSIYRLRRSPAVVELGDFTDPGCDTDGVIDLGETVDVPVSITNRGAFDITGTSATLASAYPGLTGLSGAVAYGTITPGATVTMDHQVELTSIGMCLDIAELDVTVAHDDGSSVSSFPITLGADPVVLSGTLTEDAEDNATPFTSEGAVGADDWAPTASQANSGARSWFASEIDGFADKSLLSPWLDVGLGTTTLTFALYYDLEGDATQRWDGTVLELRTEGGEWIDIGNLSTVPYDGKLLNNNTIPFRDAWSAVQTTWRDATVDLDDDYNGQRIQLRFRLVCDTGFANPGGGFWVDDIAITNVTWVDRLDCDFAGCNGIFSDGFETGDTSAWVLSTE